MHKKLAEQKAGQLTDSSQLSFAAIHKDFAHLEKSQRTLQYRFDKLGNQVTQKFDVIMNMLANGVAQRTAMEEEILAKAKVPYQRRMSFFPVEKKALTESLVSEWKTYATKIKESVAEDDDEEHNSSSDDEKKTKAGATATTPTDVSKDANDIANAKSISSSTAAGAGAGVSSPKPVAPNSPWGAGMSGKSGAGSSKGLGPLGALLKQAAAAANAATATAINGAGIGSAAQVAASLGSELDAPVESQVRPRRGSHTAAAQAEASVAAAGG